jgi:hypothetical protein
MIKYAILVKPAGNTGYELVTEDHAEGNTPRTALAAAKAVAQSYELDYPDCEVTIVRVKS